MAFVPIRTLCKSFLSPLVVIAIAINCAVAQERVALVIGNSNYQHAQLLANPKNDAELMARTLDSADFSVTLLIDADYATLKRSLVEFGRLLRGADAEAGLFYYAGHGLQLNGENFLVPVNANITNQDEVELEAIKVNDFLSVMNSSRAGVNIIILDACRNNPFAASGRSISRGLAPVDAPKGTYIAYATAPGDVALDGDQANSPYTLALSQALSQPGVPIERVFKNARAMVLEATEDQQVPWETSSITGEFYFHPATVSEEQPTAENADQSSDAPDVDSATTTNVLVDPAESLLAGAEVQTPESTTTNITVRRAEDVSAPTWPDEVCDPLDNDEFSGEICASTTHESRGDISFRPENLFDDDHDTAWVEGAEGDGIYETVVIRFEVPYEIYSVDFLNGFTKSDGIYAANGRVRDIEIRDSLGRVLFAELEDSGDWQSVEMDEQRRVAWISIEIESVYPGDTYQNTALSELWIN